MKDRNKNEGTSLHVPNETQLLSIPLAVIMSERSVSRTHRSDMQ